MDAYIFELPEGSMTEIKKHYEFIMTDRVYPKGTIIIVRDLLDTNSWMKIADGKTNFNDLPFINTEPARRLTEEELSKYNRKE